MALAEPCFLWRSPRAVVSPSCLLPAPTPCALAARAPGRVEYNPPTYREVGAGSLRPLSGSGAIGASKGERKQVSPRARGVGARGGRGAGRQLT